MTAYERGFSDGVRIGYTAGLLDGEGSVSIKRHNARGKGKEVYQSSVAIVNTSYKPLRWLQQQWGGSLYSRPQRNKNWKPVFCWEAVASMRRSFLEEISPYLKVKGRIARVVIRRERLLRSSKVSMPKSARHRLENLYRQSRAANK